MKIVVVTEHRIGILSFDEMKQRTLDIVDSKPVPHPDIKLYADSVESALEMFSNKK